jgi:hypothetical protein
MGFDRMKVAHRKKEAEEAVHNR